MTTQTDETPSNSIVAWAKEINKMGSEQAHKLADALVLLEQWDKWDDEMSWTNYKTIRRLLRDRAFKAQDEEDYASEQEAIEEARQRDSYNIESQEDN